MSGPGSSKYEVRSTKYGPEPTASPTQQSAFHTSHSDGRPLVETEGLSRDFTIGESVVHALHDVTVQIGRGELVTIPRLYQSALHRVSYGARNTWPCSLLKKGT